MVSNVNSLSSSALNSLLSSNSDPLMSALGASSAFDSIYNQAIAQDTTPAQKAQDALLAVRFDNLNVLYGAVNGTSQTPSFLDNINSLAMDLGSVSAQVNQLEQAMGLTPSASTDGQPAANVDAALGLAAQSLISRDIANFGMGTGNSLDSII